VRLNEVLQLADRQVQCWLEESLGKAMSLFNRAQ